MALFKKDVYEGHLGQPKGIRLNKYMIFDDRAHEVHKVVVHKFTMGDVEDPDLYAAQPLLEWQNSDQGRWVMERSVETPMWHRMQDPMQFVFQYAVVAWLKGPDYSFWQLKYANSVDK